MSARETVFIVDDDPTMRNSVAAIVESMNRHARVFDSAESLLDQYQPDWTGCVVSNLRLAGMSSLGLQRELAARSCPLPLVVITGHPDTAATVELMKQGAVTILEKPFANRELIDAVETALFRGARERERWTRVCEFKARLIGLTDKEREVMAFMLEGAANKVIAKALGVSIRTVESRRSQVFRKTGTASIAALVRLVIDAEGADQNPGHIG